MREILAICIIFWMVFAYSNPDSVGAWIGKVQRAAHAAYVAP